MSFFRTTQEDKGTERHKIVRARQVSAIAGIVFSTYGIFWLNNTAEGSLESSASFTATALGIGSLLCPIISELEERRDIRNLIAETQDFLRYHAERSDTSNSE
ncbi:hypothetical protein H0V99_03090 [Candidatus Saccharibacteria bacterium]|nr:hypothetical protein [Candidatus Saccharibacteria bacterium]